MLKRYQIKPKGENAMEKLNILESENPEMDSMSMRN